MKSTVSLYQWEESATGPRSQSHTDGSSARVCPFLISPQQPTKTYFCHAATESCYIFKPPTFSVSVSFFNFESRLLTDCLWWWHDCNRDYQQLAGKKICWQELLTCLCSQSSDVGSQSRVGPDSASYITGFCCLKVFLVAFPPLTFCGSTFRLIILTGISQWTQCKHFYSLPSVVETVSSMWKPRFIHLV